MKLEIIKTKNGLETAKADGIFLHSQYNPPAEAERFAQSAAADFVPQTVIVIEGALGYCVQPLRQRFPKAAIGTIRLYPDFGAYDRMWDFVLSGGAESLSGSEVIPLSEQLFSLLGEEGLYKTLFLEWGASARAFSQETKRAWQQIKTAVEKAKAVLATREYFGKKWLKNKIKFFQRIQFSAALDTIRKPVFICASGPSLDAAIPVIKKAGGKIFVCALSSAISVLLHNGIVPDLCFSTDGGYWAQRHLDALLRYAEKNRNFPLLALSSEGECSSKIFRKTKIIPLCYDDDILSQKLFCAAKIKYMTSRRNGTVSGTALEFFLANSEEDIFFAGLDLSNGKTFAHAQPNALETEASQKDFLLSPKAFRTAKNVLPSPALDIYASWFKNYSWNKNQKVYRISGTEPFKNRLGRIKDISPEEAQKLLQNIPQEKKDCSAKTQTAGEKDMASSARTVFDVIKDFSKTMEWNKEMFPAQTILFERAVNETEKQSRKEALDKKTEQLIQEIFRKLK